MSKQLMDLQKIFSRPITDLLVTKRLPPKRESLQLYRDVLKFTNHFTWNNQRGQPWKQVLRKSARKEFDLGRQQKDSILVMKMISTTREAMRQTKQKIVDKHVQFEQHVQSTRTDSEIGPSPKLTQFRQRRETFIKSSLDNK